jgi:hypothetical protein
MGMMYGFSRSRMVARAVWVIGTRVARSAPTTAVNTVKTTSAGHRRATIRR